MLSALRNALKPVLALVLAYALVVGGVLSSVAGAAGGLHFPVCSAGSSASGQSPANPAGRDTTPHDCCIGTCSTSAAALPVATADLVPPGLAARSLPEVGQPFVLRPVAVAVAARAPPAAL